MPSRPRGAQDGVELRVHVSDPRLHLLIGRKSGGAPWRLAAVKKAYALLEADIAGAEAEPRVLNNADAGMPTSMPLVASGRVHSLYKKGGGYIQYVVPSTAASCEAVGCCDPRKKVSAGR